MSTSVASDNACIHVGDGTLARRRIVYHGRFCVAGEIHEQGVCGKISRQGQHPFAGQCKVVNYSFLV